jgi:tetratricopeptide (TPR) repeat protein
MNRKQRRALGRSGSAGSGGTSPRPGRARLGAALADYRAGRLAAAEQACRRVLELDPDEPQALHLLGLVEHGQGRTEAAIDHLRAAIERDRRNPAFHHNLGNMLRGAGRSREAAACYERALALAPNSADSLFNLGHVWLELGRLEAAAGCFERALRLRPDAPELYNDLGNALADLGRFEAAAAQFRAGLARRPDNIEMLANLAAVQRAQGEVAAAQASYERALALRPDHVESLIGLGAVLVEQGRAGDGLRCHQRALALSPNHPEAHNNLGVALVELGRAPEALAHYQRALALAPGRAEFHNNLGIAHERLGRFAEALDEYGRAIALKPDYAEAHFNRAHALLLSGNFAEGWAEYEWRFAVAGDQRRFAQPLWAGEPLAGRTILVHAEQGFGDTIQFVRYAALLAARGARVVLEAPQPLLRLLASAPGIAEWVAAGAALPRFDCHCPLLSLPRVLATELATIPAATPYLAASPERVGYWRDRLPPARLRVGIAWQGNPRARHDRSRSIPLREFAPLAAIPGIRLVSLQQHDGLDQLQALPAGMRVETLGAEFDAGPDAFLDTAAVMGELDLIVTCDTAIAHLAGALGRPVFVLLADHPDWRWLTGRDDSPWYPSMRLFRQTEPGDWSGPVTNVAAALAARQR